MGAERCGVLVWQEAGILSHPQGHPRKERQQEPAVRNDRYWKFIEIDQTMTIILQRSLVCSDRLDLATSILPVISLTQFV